MTNLSAPNRIDFDRYRQEATRLRSEEMQRFFRNLVTGLRRFIGRVQRHALTHTPHYGVTHGRHENRAM